ncbi:unnamed protein product [Pleuronectes platessa]|uniref:Uncharacterized protein n=1 Tax=Pleuronectes platessa TaxID=8262 RepID=A0A9N7Z6S3_PLEPL|nr:unnamed protein product [Pleuronectes platessa]
MAFLPLARITGVISDRGTIGSGETNPTAALFLISCMPPHCSAERCWETELSVRCSHHIQLVRVGVAGSMGRPLSNLSLSRLAALSLGRVTEGGHTSLSARKPPLNNLFVV